jgi:hypothetical protein
VVQAVAGSSPLAHPHEVAAHDAFLHQGYFNSAHVELPTSYQFFVGAGVELACEPGSPRLWTAGWGRAVSGTRSESGCRCRRVRAGLQALRRVIGSQSSARSAHRPSSRAGCDHAAAQARAPGQPLGVLVPVETLARRDIPQRSFASGIRPSTIDHQPAGPAAANRAPKVPPHIGELLRAEHDALHPAGPHALCRARVGRRSRSGHPDETGENQGSSDNRGTHGELSRHTTVGGRRRDQSWSMTAPSQDGRSRGVAHAERTAPTTRTSSIAWSPSLLLGATSSTGCESK